MYVSIGLKTTYTQRRLRVRKSNATRKDVLFDNLEKITRHSLVFLKRKQGLRVCYKRLKLACD